MAKTSENKDTEQFGDVLEFDKDAQNDASHDIDEETAKATQKALNEKCGKIDASDIADEKSADDLQP